MAIDFYPFGFEQTGVMSSTEVLGGKGAGLVWMHQQGVTVPPGFIISTDVWADYDKKPKGTMKEIGKALPLYLGMLKKHFGYMPLLSIRSGSRVSCPGMMDTILNVGIDVKTTPFWIEKLGNKCFVDSTHRLITMYGSVVKGIDRQALESGTLDEAFKLYAKETGEDFPIFPNQLIGSIEAVFKSWDNERAVSYRKMEGIPREWGTAVTIQAMVFGNLNEQSGTGVLFTRNPDTGECVVTGDFLANAQGEDIVAGIRTPMPLESMVQWNKPIHDELITTVTNLEKLRRDMQDVEFTVQDGKLYILQTRNAKRTAQAALRIAVEMANDGVLTKVEAAKRVTAKQFDLAQLPRIHVSFKKLPVFTGIPACSGIVTGKPVFTSKDAINCKESCILVTDETTPNDIDGMMASKGVITMKGGKTCHAAVVARGANKPCITGVGQSLEVFKECEVISMDGATGRIWLEKVPIDAGEKNGLISAFTRLVTDALGVVPIIHDIPVEPMNEALFAVGTRMLNPEEAAYTIAKASAKVGKLYVDLTPVTEESEIEFLSICNIDYAQQVANHLEGLTDTEDLIFSTLRDRLVLVGPVKSMYFNMIGSGNDLRSLVMADGEILVGDASNDPAIVKVMQWKLAEGVAFVSVGSITPGLKSIISVEQALQAIGVV